MDVPVAKRLGAHGFRHPLLLVFVLIMGAVCGTIYLIIVDAQRRIIEHEAVKIAEVVARQALASRTVYSRAVADKSRDDGFGPDIAYESLSGHVPLPAQFLKLVGKEASLTSDGLYRYRPLSKWNLEPTQGLTDEFQRWAWRALEAQDRVDPRAEIDWEPVWRFDTVGDVKTLRYVRADPASSTACVSCHNKHEREMETIARRVAAGVAPGKQWTQHQLLGAIEVEVPVDKVEALAAYQTRQTLLLVLFISIVGLSVAGWFAVKDLQRKDRLVLEFERQAKFDALTGLPNRRLFEERAAEAMARAGRDGGRFGVLFLDVDRLKPINDSLGHAVGDLVLRDVAERLLSSLREVDTVARLSGDEFAVLLHGVAGTPALTSVAEKILAVIARPLVYQKQELYVTASIGLCAYPRDGSDVRTLIKNADAAMYRAKDRGRNTYQFFRADMDERATETLELSRGLRQAIERSQFELHYQPRVTVATGRVSSVEALLRWRHPTQGLLSPERFLHAAEDLGLIEQIGDWVLRDALAQLRVWRAAGLGTFRVAVNISPRQFSGLNFVQRLRAHLEWSGVPPELLELEITEGAVIHDPQGVADILAQCHAMGIKLAMDDFGTGYSSLAYLKRFPIDFLKIDKSFVDGLPSDPNDRALVNAIIAMAHNLDIRVVGEGVETEAQRAYLAAQQCYELQGYFFAPPCPAAALEPILRTGFGGAWLRSNPVPAEA